MYLQFTFGRNYIFFNWNVLLITLQQLLLIIVSTLYTVHILTDIMSLYPQYPQYILRTNSADIVNVNEGH